MEREIIKEIKGLNYGCSKCIYSKDDDISCLRNGGCGTENARQYYELVNHEQKQDEKTK